MSNFTDMIDWKSESQADLLENILTIDKDVFLNVLVLTEASQCHVSIEP
jgi:hypothetical protein